MCVQGDRYKRLASNYQTEQGDWIRNMSNVSDGPEQLMDAEEYFNPNRGAENSSESPLHHTFSNRAGSVSNHSQVYDPRRVKRYDNETVIGFSSPSRTTTTSIDSDQGQPLLSEARYSGLEADGLGQRRGILHSTPRRSSNLRYSSDPCRVASESDNRRPSNSDRRHPSVNEEPATVAMPMEASSEDVFSNGGIQRIALDEDGYLEPKSTSNSGGYIVVMQGWSATTIVDS